MLKILLFLFLLKGYNGHLIKWPHQNGTEVKSFNKSALYYGPHEHFDWRDQNMVSPVKDQGECAAYWAFSVIANIESHLKINHDVEEILSEQFLIDCDDARKGCGDGSIVQTFANIVTILGGVLRNRDYRPYAEKRMQCQWNLGKSKHGSPPNFYSLQRKLKLVPVMGFQRVLPDEEVMARFVQEHGPLSTTINSKSMAKYGQSNYIDEPSDEECDPKHLNHAVLIVGYSVYVSESGVKLPYWIIKNSWGVNWGDRGFYYLVRGRNACGIATDVSFAYV